jgi:hypothetical protein
MSKSDLSAKARSAKVETNPNPEYPNPQNSLPASLQDCIDRLGRSLAQRSASMSSALLWRSAAVLGRGNVRPT